MKPLAECQIVIVGLGLMGGSLAGALRGRCRSVVGVGRRPEAVAEAERGGWIDAGTVDLPLALSAADVVVLATPVRTIVEQLTTVAPHLPPGCLVMDLGSTKREIAAAMERLPEGVEPLGGHPMCGKESSGLGVADVGLYSGATFILTPLARTSPAAVALGRAMVEAVGARPLVLDPARQDRLVATLSHLPYLLACALVRTAGATTSSDPAAWEIIAGGFRDTSRVAGSDVAMMTDILLTNRDAVIEAAGVFRSALGELVGFVDRADEASLREVLAASRDERRRMFR